MYNGIKRKIKRPPLKIYFPTKFQMLASEETVINGIVRTNLVMKTIDRLADHNIKYTDFEVTNLQAAGINVLSQPETKMTPNKEKIAAMAERATDVMDLYEQLNEQNNEVPSKTTQETNAN